VVFAVVLDLVNFYANRHSPTKDIRDAAEFLLISNLIFAGILALGLALKRRALLGFGAFFFGLEQAFSEHDISLGIPFIAFGGWLIMRASQKQKQDRPAGGARGSSRTPARTATKSPKPASGRPKASKRYTPPQRARGSAGK
jgi:predicted lipid-binding transport protein (Tim44 family)